MCTKFNAKFRPVDNSSHNSHISDRETFVPPHCAKAKAQTPLMVVIITTYTEAHQPSAFPLHHPISIRATTCLYTSPHTLNEFVQCGPVVVQKSYPHTGRKEIVISQIKRPTPGHRPPIQYVGEHSNTSFFLVVSLQCNPTEPFRTYLLRADSMFYSATDTLILCASRSSTLIR